MRKSTYGENAVGLAFNPAGDEKVAKVKKLYAEIIDLMDDLRKSDDSKSSGEHKALNDRDKPTKPDNTPN